MTATAQFQTAAHRDLTHETTRWQRLLYDGRATAGALFSAKQLTAAKAGANKAGIKDANDFGAEIFARLYDDPNKLDKTAGPGWVPPAHDLLDALPEWQALRESVAGDPDMAALATAECMQAIAPKIGELLKEGEREPGNGRPGSSTSAEAAAVRAALRRGIAKAEQVVGQAREGLMGLAPGLETAPPSHEQADPGRLRLAEQVLNNPRLRDVLRKAGRIQRLARDRRTTKERHARQEVVDIERGADLARMLPSSLARLRHPKLRVLALRDIIERQALQYRMEGREPLGRGPLIVLVDRSGSMQGAPETWASAAAIALIGIGVREKRAVAVVEFTTTVDHSLRVDAKGKCVASFARGAPVTVAQMAMHLASRRSSGGTDFGPVLCYALAIGALNDRADLVFITDGLAEADEATLAKLTEAKKRGLRVYAFTVNGGSLSLAIEQIADVAIDLDREADIGAAIANAMPQ